MDVSPRGSDGGGSGLGINDDDNAPWGSDGGGSGLDSYDDDNAAWGSNGGGSGLDSKDVDAALELAELAAGRGQAAMSMSPRQFTEPSPGPYQPWRTSEFGPADAMRTSADAPPWAEDVVAQHSITRRRLEFAEEPQFFDLFEGPGFKDPNLEGAAGGQSFDLAGPAEEQRSQYLRRGLVPPGETFQTSTPMMDYATVRLANVLGQLGPQVPQVPIVAVWGTEAKPVADMTELFWRCISRGLNGTVNLSIQWGGKIRGSLITFEPKAENKTHPVMEINAVPDFKAVHVVLQGDLSWDMSPGGARTPKPVLFVLLNQIRYPAQVYYLHSGAKVPINARIGGTVIALTATCSELRYIEKDRLDIRLAQDGTLRWRKWHQGRRGVLHTAHLTKADFDRLARVNLEAFVDKLLHSTDAEAVALVHRVLASGAVQTVAAESAPELSGKLLQLAWE
jgi:hypothetical protein